MIKRKPNRLRNYDYSQDGYYFVTICTRCRNEWFGEVIDGEMKLSKLGEIAYTQWTEMPFHFKFAKIDEFTIMPNHVHGIVIIENESVGDAYMRSLQDRTKMLLSNTIQQFKSAVTRKINLLSNHFCFQWQKSFYDHIIRSEKTLDLIREYIQNNPLKWDLDRENPLSKNFNLDHDRYWKEIYCPM